VSIRTFAKKEEETDFNPFKVKLGKEGPEKKGTLSKLSSFFKGMISREQGQKDLLNEKFQAFKEQQEKQGKKEGIAMSDSEKVSAILDLIERQLNRK